MNHNRLLVVVAAIVLASCVSTPTREQTTQVVKSSFVERGAAKLDRLDQTDLQVICSQAALDGKPVPKDVAQQIEKAAMASIKYPADGKYLGDYKQGERIAQSGVGMQWSDAPTAVRGGNCYACHEMAPQEISYGNIGPSLKGYGKLRGSSEAVVKYTWGKIWNTHAFNVCSAMPRFGDAGILSEAQIKDVMALLLDPQSPVNK